MGLSYKLVSSDGIEFHDWSSSRPILRDHEAAGADQTPISAPKERQLPQDRVSNRSEPLRCPRCESPNTKFCYFNNYNKSQPRHFCKTCRRHWTKGGTLRDVPVGGNRKKKRLKTAAAATSASSTAGIAVDAAITTSVVAKHSKPAFDSEMFADSNISDSVLSLPHQDIMDLLPFPVSSLSDSMITSLVPTTGCSVPMTWQSGIEQEVAAASFWSWEDIESLVSTNQGSAWDDSKA